MVVKNAEIEMREKQKERNEDDETNEEIKDGKN